jgi:hypothetical protein
MATSIEEPINEYFQGYDPLSGGVIVCANRSHCRSDPWIEQFVYSKADTSEVRRIDVTSNESCSDNVDMIFTHDSFVDSKQVSTYSQMLVDYSCAMHDALMKTKRVVVYCKNGRSRSPCVVLAFYLLRGMPRDHAVEYLTLAFQNQRPTIYERSANFRKTYTVAFNFTVLPILVSNTMNSSLPIHSQFRQVSQSNTCTGTGYQEECTMDQGKNCDEIGRRGHLNISWH